MGTLNKRVNNYGIPIIIFFYPRLDIFGICNYPIDMLNGFFIKVPVGDSPEYKNLLYERIQTLYVGIIQIIKNPRRCMTVPNIRVVTVRCIVCPVSAENKNIIIAGKIAEIKLQGRRNLFKRWNFYRLSQAYNADTGINFFYCIGIGGNNICIKALCHFNNYFFAPANGTKIIVKDRNPQGSSPGFINPLSTISSGNSF